MNDTDRRFIELAIAEARKCVPEDDRTHPMVGAVIVRGGELLASAHRGMRSPGEHAEYTVLDLTEGMDLSTASVYTTMEPCTTRGSAKSPCVSLLAQRRIARIFIGMLDPNPVITGRGLLRLRQANVETELFPAAYMRIVEEMNAAFARHHDWPIPDPTSPISEPTELLYEDAADPELPGSEERLAAVTLRGWDTELARLLRVPTDLYQLLPRKFEELIAELLARDGFEVHLTPTSRDGGRDILAFHESALGRHLYLVECKRYAPSRPVDVGLVRTLYGVIEHERASSGIIVTTSSFTADAMKFRSRVEYRLHLKAYSDVKEWIRKALS